MPTTIDDLAIANLFSALTNVVTGNTAVGTFAYQTTLTPVLSSRLGTVQTPGVAGVVQIGLEPLAEYPAMHDEYHVHLGIQVHAGSVLSPSTTIETQLRLYAADIRLALGVDIQRGGKAINTLFDPDIYEVEMDPPFVIVPVKLHIRTLRNNRYSN